MPFQHKRLVGPLALTTSSTLVYTVPANKTSIIKQVVVTNTTGSSATFTLRIGTTTAIFNGVTVAANDSLLINLSQVLTTAETLYALASANSTLNLTISGVENDGPIEPTETYIADGAITAAKLANTAGAVMVFADSSARSTAIPSPTQGMMTYIENTDEVQVYDGSTWLTLVVTNDDNQIVTSSYIQADQLYVYASGSGYGEFVSSNPTGAFLRLGRGTSASVTEQIVLGSAAQLVSSGTLANSAIMARGGTLTLGTGTFAGITIDANQRVTMPYQPAFMAHQTAGTSVSNGATMPFNYASINRGNHYNTSTYRFTAPVAGVYVFGGMIRIDADQAYVHSHVKINNTLSPYQGELPGLSGAGGSGLGFTANGASAYMRNMSAGDYIEFPVYWYSGGPYTLHQQSFIFGYLLG